MIIQKNLNGLSTCIIIGNIQPLKKHGMIINKNSKSKQSANLNDCLITEKECEEQISWAYLKMARKLEKERHA